MQQNFWNDLQQAGYKNRKYRIGMASVKKLSTENKFHRVQLSLTGFQVLCHQKITIFLPYD